MARGLNSAYEQRQFIRRLTETIFWCRHAGSLLEPRTSLRTCKPDVSDLRCQDGWVFEVAVERSHRLWSIGKRDLSPVSDLGGGRLMAYFPEDNLADGVAEAESRGFFDVDNIPPYDTWVWMVRNVTTFEYDDGVKGEMDANYLVAWVPPDFTALASGGIEVNPEQCIQWLDTIDDAFTQSLVRLGLLREGPQSPSVAGAIVQEELP
jgi:hypothetical protein